MIFLKIFEKVKNKHCASWKNASIDFIFGLDNTQDLFRETPMMDRKIQGKTLGKIENLKYHIEIMYIFLSTTGVSLNKS